VPTLSTGIGSDAKSALKVAGDQLSIDETKDNEALIAGNAFIHQTASKQNTLKHQLSHCKKLGSMSSSKKAKSGIQKRLFHQSESTITGNGVTETPSTVSGM
jgi:hypothetical protein